MKALDRRDELRRSLAFLALGSVIMATIFACSSRDDLITFGGGTNDGGPPPFTPTDAGNGQEASPPQLPDRLMCATTECPTPFASCPSFGAPPPYACSIDLASDPDNCGECGHLCPRSSTAYHFKRACSDGVCRPICEVGYVDCNGIPDDGCESEPNTDSNNCGACGNTCPAGVACIEGRCGCPPGTTNCNGACVDVTNDDENCGGCGFKCADNQPGDAGAVPPNMFYGCFERQCKYLRCYHDDNVFWADCNDSIDPDGCEVDLARPNRDHCGKCGNACEPKQECFSADDTGMDCQCKGGKHLCPPVGWMPQGCFDLENDPRNCGSCGYTCPTIDGADATCHYGKCDYTCRPGRADANGRADDGCEVDLTGDPRNCGSVGIVCDVANGQPCAGGRCAMVPCDGGTGPVQ